MLYGAAETKPKVHPTKAHIATLLTLEFRNFICLCGRRVLTELEMFCQ